MRIAFGSEQIASPAGSKMSKEGGNPQLRSRHILREIVSLLRRTSLHMDKEDDPKISKDHVRWMGQMLERLIYGVCVDHIQFSNRYLSVIIGRYWLDLGG